MERHEVLGPALTVRCVPANRPMWKLTTTEEIVAAHGIWFKEMGNINFRDRIQEGHVVVTNTGGARARSASGGRKTAWARWRRARSASSPTATAAIPPK